MRLQVKTSFDIDYPKENRKYYYNGSPKRRLVNMLLESCRGYCMYCGKTVTLEGDYLYQIEHSVDKGGNEHQEADKNDVLKHCKYNLSISCRECNQVCKKSVEKVNLHSFEPIEACPPSCTQICQKYYLIRREYEKKNAIILQPVGVKELGNYAISYNLLKHLYEASDEFFDEETIFFIQNHINRFELNGRRFSPAVIDICVKVVSYIGFEVRKVNNIFVLLDDINPENIIGVDFIRFLKDYFSDRSDVELEDFCKLLIILDTVN